MIFGSEQRFSDTSRSLLHRDIIGFAPICETGPFQGPGCYFEQREENKRNGWDQTSFSKKVPMDGSPALEVDRSFHYVTGIISHGLTVLSSPKKAESPGPGYYSPTFSTRYDSPNKERSGSPSPPSGGATSHGRTHILQSSLIDDPLLQSRPPFTARSEGGSAVMRSSSSRLIDPASVCKGEVLFRSTSSSRPSGIGPGYYSLSSSFNLIRKTHNTRAKRSNSNRSKGRDSSNNNDNNNNGDNGDSSDSNSDSNNCKSRGDSAGYRSRSNSKSSKLSNSNKKNISRSSLIDSSHPSNADSGKYGRRTLILAGETDYLFSFMQ